MAREAEEYAHPTLVDGSEVELHTHPGGGGNGKEMDAGTYNVLVSKGWEAVPFNITFTTAPAVCVTIQDVAGGKKVGQKDATTTGFDITAEAIMDCDWIALEKG